VLSFVSLPEVESLQPPTTPCSNNKPRAAPWLFGVNPLPSIARVCMQMHSEDN
jgi:hypothetical protein